MACKKPSDALSELAGRGAVGWGTSGQPPRLHKRFSLASFAEAVEFLAEVRKVADAANHHPDVCIEGYNKVDVYLVTHDEGCITEKDVALALEIEKIYARFAARR